MKQDGLIPDFAKVIKALEGTKKQDVQNTMEEIIKRMHNEFPEDKANSGEEMLRAFFPILVGFYTEGAKKFCSLMLDYFKSQQGENDIHAS